MYKKQHKRSVFTYSLPEKGKGQSCEGVFVSIISNFRRQSGSSINGFIPRITNTITKHFRGIFGMLLPIYCALTWEWEKDAHYVTVKFMWLCMFWFFLLQPVPVPVTGLIPIFFLPMTGVLSTQKTCACYMNESILLFILSSVLVLLMNNSGVDRRIALWFMCYGDNCQFSEKGLLLKTSSAAFVLSMFSNRLLVTNTITDYVTEALTDLQSATDANRGIEPDYNELRYIINNAVQTSSSMGGIAIIHSSYASLCFRAMFYESAPEGTEYPDIFNYFQYSLYAFPVASLMFVINFCFHRFLIDEFVGKPISPNSMKELRNALLQYKNSLPRRITLHEKLTVFFTFFSLIIFFTRWNHFLNMGWGDFSTMADGKIPRVKDATVAAIFVIVLHILPKGYGWLNYIHAEKKSDLPPLKAESAILWWRFVDKNINYGYIFLIGSGVALHAASKETGLDKRIVEHFGKMFSSENAFTASLILVCLVTVIITNVMSGVAACVSVLPVILSMASEPPSTGFLFRTNTDWHVKMYLGALGVGIASSFGFMFPFLYTPAYYCHYVGKVPMKRMVIYSMGSTVICLVTLWLSLVVLAPYVLDPDGTGVTPIPYGVKSVSISATVTNAIHTSNGINGSNITGTAKTASTKTTRTTTSRTTTTRTTTTRTSTTMTVRVTTTKRTRRTWRLSPTTYYYSETPFDERY